MTTLILIFLTSSIAFVTANSDSNCPKELHNCTCSDNEVNCDLRGYTVLPDDVTVDLNMLYFRFERNNLTSIGDKYFRNFIKMQSLSLKENQICNITENAFFHNVALRTLDFSHNRIKHLPKTLFKRLNFLETVYLNNNELTRIETDLFSHIITLQRLRFHNNKLTFIGKDAFVKSEGLVELYLEFNNLEIPEKDWLIHFMHTTTNYEVYLDNNPWSCDCRMKEFYEWAKRNPWFIAHTRRGVSVPECTYPLSLRGTRLPHISSADALTCTAANITSTMHDVNTVEGKDVKIDCQATGLPPAEVSITDPQGKVLAISRGSASVSLTQVEMSQSGVYHCRAAGFNKDAVPDFKTASIDLTVYRAPGNVIAAVLISLLFVGVGMSALVWICKKKYGHRAKYGLLANNSAHYDASDVTASAAYNAQSIRAPTGGSTTPTSVLNPYNGRVADSADDDDDDVITEYSKDTEFLV